MSNATIPDSIGNPIDFTQHLHIPCLRSVVVQGTLVRVRVVEGDILVGRIIENSTTDRKSVF